MITAEQAKAESDKLKKEAREIYLSNFDQIYKEVVDKLEVSINAVIRYGHNKTFIIVHDVELADKLEKECIANGFKVKYDIKERQFSVEW